MRRIMSVFLVIGAVVPLAAQQAFGFYDLAAGASASVQGASVINAGRVTFAYGGGLRGSAQINPLARLQGAVEYMNRDADFALQTLDISAVMDFGNPFFLGLGLYTALILDGVPTRGWDYFATTELGWATEVGYRFPSLPGLTLGFDVHMALTDLFPKENSGAGYVNQLGIRWGFWLGYDFLRGR
ncbi:MAG: hypothetical protein WCL50_03370 [Spirochaetota bacterium]